MNNKIIGNNIYSYGSTKQN